MVIADVNNRNITIVADIVDAKLLVGLLRAAEPAQHVKAAEAVRKDGFNLAQEDSEGVSRCFARIVGTVTDKAISAELYDLAHAEATKQ